MWLATDVYLDEALIYSFGNTIDSETDFEYYNPHHKTPIPLDQEAGKEHLLAVDFIHYQGELTPRDVKLNAENLSNFINLNGPNFINIDQDYQNTLSNHSILRITLSFIFLILFFLMYLQNPGEKAF